jgi:Glycosyl hydrolase family 76
MADFPIQQGIRLQEFHLEWVPVSSGSTIGTVYWERYICKLGYDDVRLDANYSYAHSKPSNKELMTPDFSVHDGADVPDCTKIDYIQWTYNNGQFLAGSAYMYNYVPPISFHLTRQTAIHTGKIMWTNSSQTHSVNSLQIQPTSSTNQPAK